MAAARTPARRRMGACETTPPATLREHQRDPEQTNRKRALPQPRGSSAACRRQARSSSPLRGCGRSSLTPGHAAAGPAAARKDPEEQSAQPGGARSHRVRSVRPLDTGGPYGCRRQGLPGCRGAGILVRRACCRSPVAAGGEADRGSRREGEQELRPGGRRDPRTPRRLGFWPGAWRPRAIRGTHASPDHPADGGSETSRRSRPVRSLVAAAQEGAAAWRVRTLPCRHVE